MHVGSFSDVIISLHTELAELIKLRAADRILWGIKCRLAERNIITNFCFCPFGLKGLTIIYKFLFRLYFHFYTISFTYIVNILVPLSRQLVRPCSSFSFVYFLTIWSILLFGFTFYHKIYKPLLAYTPYLFQSPTEETWYERIPSSFPLFPYPYRFSYFYKLLPSIFS